MFIRAGWYPRRRAWLTRFDGLESLTSFRRGAALIREFGGLHVGRTRPGRDQAASDISFFRRPSVQHRYAVERIEHPDDDLFPLGCVQQRYLDLFLDSREQVWVYSIVCGRLWQVGNTFTDSIERLLLGWAFVDGPGNAPDPVD